MKKIIYSGLLLFAISSAPILSSAAAMETTIAFSVKNNTNTVIEFSGLIGGYAATNPVITQNAVTIIPDPNSKIIRGHMMLFTAGANHYTDNLVFDAQSANGQWQVKVFDLYNAVSVSVKNNMVLINKS